MKLAPAVRVHLKPLPRIAWYTVSADTDLSLTAGAAIASSVVAATLGVSASDITITRYKIGNGPWQTYATRSRQLQDSLTTAGDISYEFEVPTSSSSSADVLAAATDVSRSGLVQGSKHRVDHQWCYGHCLRCLGWLTNCSR
jgi:hypothetical protein